MTKTKWKPLKDGKRVIHKPNHITLRISGGVQQVLERHMKRSGLDRTHVICELILYADRIASNRNEEVVK